MMLMQTSTFGSKGLKGYKSVYLRPSIKVAQLHTSLTARRRPSEPSTNHHPVDEGLGLSLFVPFSRLPPDGEVSFSKEEMCDPDVSACKTTLYVYESSCTACCASGLVRGLANGRRGALSSCPSCLGLGYLRRTTTRFTPYVNGSGKNWTLVRPSEGDGADSGAVQNKRKR